MLRKIISGGQTGADRAGLDFALQAGLEHGGYVAKGRKPEDGRIDDRCQLVELLSKNARSSSAGLVNPFILRVARKVAWWMDQSPELREERPSHRSKSRGSKGFARFPVLALAARTGSLPEAPRGNNDRADSPERWRQSEHPWRRPQRRRSPRCAQFPRPVHQ